MSQRKLGELEFAKYHALGNDCLRIQGCPSIEAQCFSLPEA